MSDGTKLTILRKVWKGTGGCSQSMQLKLADFFFENSRELQTEKDENDEK